MSFDRYVLVCHTFTDFSKFLRKHKTPLFIAAAVWVLAILFCIPVIKFSGIVGNYPDCQCA